MSVINKMLRDLDQNQGNHPSNTTAQRATMEPALQQGIQSVPLKGKGTGRSAAGPVRRGAWAAVALALVGGVGAAAWWTGLLPQVEPKSEAPLAPQVSAVVAVPAPAVVASAPVALSAVLPAEGASAIGPSEPTPAATAALAAPPAATAPVADGASALVAAPLSAKPEAATLSRSAPGNRSTAVANTGPAPNPSLRMETMLPTRKALEAVLSSSAAPAGKAASPAPEATSPAQRQQQASTDALAQAQSLWNTGNHAAALDLMQQSVDAAERAVKAGSSAVGNPVLLSLVRELVRMHMAQSRFAAVWELLVRLEPVLGNAPDLWALRGNTAQRLGHHQDSVNAYRMALQTNPNEQRWLLGSAVSLAALGQTSQAAEMAERARSVGEISREVQAYLRQLGVPLKDK